MARPIFVLDLEATCWEDLGAYTVDETEIIEIGCVMATPAGEVLDEFGTFVRPVNDPVLSEFCTQLTSITQQDVDQAPVYQEAMRLLDGWVGHRGGIWGSWGNYDFRQFASMEKRYPSHCEFLKKLHVNLKKSWRQTTRHNRTSLRSALKFHGLDFEGTHHRGIDDARNIARLLPLTDYHKILAGVGALQRGNA